METKEALYKRRSTRSYTSQPISDQDLQEIIDAGLMAPSAVNLQPWYFAVIRSKEAMEQLLEIMGQVSAQIEPSLQARFPNHPEVVRETTGFIRQMGGAPVCILAFQFKPDYDKSPATIVQCVAAATENMLLAAADKGIGSCWLTAPLEVGAGPALQARFAPGKGGLAALITLGYPAQEAKAPPRKAGRFHIL